MKRKKIIHNRAGLPEKKCPNIPGHMLNGHKPHYWDTWELDQHNILHEYWCTGDEQRV